MTHVNLVGAALKQVFDVSELRDGALVTTQCLYPSNGFVQVLVRGGIDHFVVSDEGGAVREVELAGVELKSPDRQIRHISSSLGLVVSDGTIRSPSITSESLAVAIALVANASKSTAEWLFAKYSVRPQHRFKDVVSEFLKLRFRDSVVEASLVGQSNKSHKFENVIQLSGDRKLILDPVSRDPNSINARVVANMDVRAMKYPNVEQRIVYDDAADWSPEDLSLLQAGATVVPYSKAPMVIERLAA